MTQKSQVLQALQVTSKVRISATGFEDSLIIASLTPHDVRAVHECPKSRAKRGCWRVQGKRPLGSGCQCRLCNRASLPVAVTSECNTFELCAIGVSSPTYLKGYKCRGSGAKVGYCLKCSKFPHPRPYSFKCTSVNNLQYFMIPTFIFSHYYPLPDFSFEQIFTYICWLIPWKPLLPTPRDLTFTQVMGPEGGHILLCSSWAYRSSVLCLLLLSFFQLGWTKCLWQQYFTISYFEVNLLKVGKLPDTILCLNFHNGKPD